MNTILGQAVAKAKSWQDAADRYNAAAGDNLSANAVQQRARRAGIARGWGYKRGRPSGIDPAALKHALETGVGWRGVADAYRRRTGHACRPRTIKAAAAAAGLKLVRADRVDDDALRRALASAAGWQDATARYRRESGRWASQSALRRAAYRLGIAPIPAAKPCRRSVDAAALRSALEIGVGWRSVAWHYADATGRHYSPSYLRILAGEAGLKLIHKARRGRPSLMEAAS